MTSEYSRDPDAYQVTSHIRTQSHERNFNWEDIKRAVKNGEIDEELPKKDHQIAYRLSVPGVDFVLIVDHERMNYVTGYWDDEQGARGGKL